MSYREATQFPGRIWQRAWCYSGSDDFWGERVLVLVVYKYTLGEEQSRQRANLCTQQREHAAFVPPRFWLECQVPPAGRKGARGDPSPHPLDSGLVYISPLCLTNVVVIIAMKKFGKY